MNYVKLIILVFVFILAVSFASENTQSVTLRYYFNWETPSFPMYLLMFIPFFIGVVVGSLVGVGARLRLGNTVNRLQKSNRKLEERLKQAQEAQISREYETPALEEGTTDTEVISTT
jgi:putative membrane protein